MSYSKLKSDVAAWMHRDKLTDQMDNFALFTETDINNDLRVLEMEVRVPITFINAFTNLPDDYVGNRALQINVAGGRRPIPQMTPQQLDSRLSRVTGPPQAYAIHGDQIEIRPGPDIDADAITGWTGPVGCGIPLINGEEIDGVVYGEWSYYARVPSLTTQSTNKILEKYPTIYHAGMMFQACTYVQDAEEQVKWAEIYNNQVKVANKAASRGRWNLPSVRSA